MTQYEKVKSLLYHSYGCYHKKIANNTHLTLIENIYYPDHIGIGIEVVVMKLHGNTVAKFYPDKVCLFDGGWRTNTTKNRLNLALNMAGILAYVYQKDWEWYIHDEPDIYVYQKDGEWYIHDESDIMVKFTSGMMLSYDGELL